MTDLAKNEVPIPPSDVWPLLTDGAAWPQWMPSVTEVTNPPSAGSLREGMTIEIVFRAQGYGLVIERLQPPNELVLRQDFSRLSQLIWLFVSPPMKSIAWTWRIEASGSSGSKVTVKADLRHTMLGRILGGWFGRIMENMFNFKSRPLQKAFVKYARTFPQGA